MGAFYAGVNHLGLSRFNDNAVPHADGAAPRAGDTLFEIGLVITLHLAFAVAVLATLDAFGVC